ncbi:hypothetical protein PV08_10289 [Exophiala spinifera]|uniref:Rad51-like C-terminal domain-containing protein n=1 Tax=Exophiala spinifera TaxID=91928 RepID=A0A0D2AX51_9EURO|nr:uncharacterized protein PV08_10289 [Exophiala spinifera]KIW10990.1 hypothetical protein PV08_10289 [Exophiala spinifera]
MSAEQYGARLLEDVQEESLEQFLAEVRLRSHRLPVPHSQDVTTTSFARLHALLDPAGVRNVPGPPTTRQAGLEIPTTHITAPEVDPSGGGGGGEVEGEDERHDISHPHRGYQRLTSPTTTVEITSRKSSCGKTTLLYHLSALAALPKTHGGRESMVVYIDSDGTFSATRLHRTMQHCLLLSLRSSTRAQQQDRQGVDMTAPLGSDKTLHQTVARDALTHVLVFRPQSSTHLIAILDSLPTLLLDRTKHSSIYRPLGLVVLDSALSFYWQDRLDRDMARLQPRMPAAAGAAAAAAAGGGGGGSGVGVGVGTAVPGPSFTETTTTTTRTGAPSLPPPQPSPRPRTSQIIERLQNVQKKFECAVVFSTTTNPNTHTPASKESNTTSTSTTGSVYARPAQNQTPTPIQAPPPPPPPPPNETTPAISPWTAYASLTLHLDKARVPQFAPQMSLEECLRDAEKRFDAVRSARIVATVTKSASTNAGGKRDLEGQRGLQRRQSHGFTFKISDGGCIDFEEEDTTRP